MIRLRITLEFSYDHLGLPIYAPYDNASISNYFPDDMDDMLRQAFKDHAETDEDTVIAYIYLEEPPNSVDLVIRFQDNGLYGVHYKDMYKEVLMCGAFGRALELDANPDAIWVVFKGE